MKTTGEKGNHSGAVIGLMYCLWTLLRHIHQQYCNAGPGVYGRADHWGMK